MRVNLIRFGVFTPKLKELRIHLSPTDDASKGVREYIQRFYPTLKADNPKLPILVRECSGVQPRLWARFAKGKEVSVVLTNQSPDDIRKQIDAVGN